MELLVILRNAIGNLNRRPAWTLLWILLVVAVWPVPGQASLIMDDDPRVSETGLVFSAIAKAWEQSDEKSLAAMVHEDGLRVNSGSSGSRPTRYSPSQAFYYFKSLFQSHRTLVFEFEMVQDASDGDRVHGMAVWKRRRPDSEEIQVVKLVCVLTRLGSNWMLTEINTIR